MQITNNIMHSCLYRITFSTKFNQPFFEGIDKDAVSRCIENTFLKNNVDYSELSVQSSLIGFTIELIPNRSIKDQIVAIRKLMVNDLKRVVVTDSPMFATSFLCTTLASDAKMAEGDYVGRLKRSYRDAKGELL